MNALREALESAGTGAAEEMARWSARLEVARGELDAAKDRVAAVEARARAAEAQVSCMQS